MLNRLMIACAILLFFLQANAAVDSQEALGEQFGDWLVKRYQPTIDTMTHHGWDHSNSVILHGLEKVYKNTNNPAYLNYIQAYADSFVNADGSINGLRDTLDGLHPGVVCLFLYSETKEQKYLTAAKNMRDFFLGTAANPSPFNKTPDGAYWHKNVEKYHNVASVDGLYMVYPFLVRLGVLLNDKALLDLAAEQILLISERSFNIKYKLPFHAWNYDKTKPWAHPITGTSTQFWSRASGWYSMALVDVLEYLPEEHPAYNKIAGLYQSLAQGLVNVQNPQDGLWYQVLDQVGEPGNYPETSASGMIVYALQKGVNLQLLDQGYAQNAQQGWQALKGKVGVWKDGGPQFQGFAPGMSAQNSYKEYVAIKPVNVPSEGTKQHAHGYMAILLAASVMEPQK